MNILDAADPERSALAEAVESAQRAESVRTHAELLADAAELATAGRTARWLDELVHAGHLTPGQRIELAAEDGANNLNRLLRRAELAGHDPRDVLRTAVVGRRLHDARQVTNVLHHRITETVTLDPSGDNFRDWVPRVDNPRWQHYLEHLATATDERTRHLGRETARAQPQWACEALGPLPDDPAPRDEWTRRAGLVAAHRELTGHEEPGSALGSAPRPGDAQAYASWRAAWRALGRPEADRAEAEMTDGQLRVRVRAWERERVWAPRYVANELAGTNQAAEQHRGVAALRRAEAEAAPDDDTRDRLRREAHEASSLAEVLTARAAELEEAGRARGLWYAHTAETRVAADRAAAELGTRQADAAPPEPVVTAEEWLVEHRAAGAEEDPHRVVGDEADLAHADAQRRRDLATIDPMGEPVAETEPVRAIPHLDIDEDHVRVPSADETAATISRARAALAKIQRRQEYDDARTAEEARAEQNARWRGDDLAASSADRSADLSMDGLGR